MDAAGAQDTEAMILLASKAALSSSKFKVGVLASFCVKYKLRVGSSGVRGHIKCDYMEAILLYVSALTNDKPPP